MYVPGIALCFGVICSNSGMLDLYYYFGRCGLGRLLFCQECKRVTCVVQLSTLLCAGCNIE